MESIQPSKQIILTQKHEGNDCCHDFQSIYLSNYLSIYRSFYIDIFLSISPSISPSTSPSISPSISLSPHLSIYLPISPSIYLSVYLSIYLFIYEHHLEQGCCRASGARLLSSHSTLTRSTFDLSLDGYFSEDTISSVESVEHLVMATY